MRHARKIGRTLIRLWHLRSNTTYRHWNYQWNQGHDGYIFQFRTVYRNTYYPILLMRHNIEHMMNVMNTLNNIYNKVFHFLSFFLHISFFVHFFLFLLLFELMNLILHLRNNVVNNNLLKRLNKFIILKF